MTRGPGLWKFNNSFLKDFNKCLCLSEEELWRFYPKKTQICCFRQIGVQLQFRIERFLLSIIHPDQTGFMKGWYIGQNIRLFHIIQQTELLKIPGILWFLDLQKAFDTLEWPFTQNTLSLSNFGNGIKKLDLYILYKFWEQRLEQWFLYKLL